MYFLILCLSLILRGACIIFLILHAGIGLGPDEAQYWTWSQLLDWGYYSKPPGIAWEIWLGTKLFGNTELGVRAGSILIGSLLPIALFFLAKACRLRPATCFWTSIAFAFSPLGILASFLAITDSGMVLFWAIACLLIVHKIDRQRPPSYFLIGIAISCGALFKWPIYFLWILLLASWIKFPFMASRPFRTLISGLAISLCALLPSLYWNRAHEWATFRHVFSTLLGGHGPAMQSSLQAKSIFGNPLEFLGSQFALASPLLFILLLISFYSLFKQKISLGLFFCGAVSLSIFAISLCISFLMKLQGNWCIFVYPTTFVFMGWYYCEKIQKPAWLYAGIVLSIILCIFVFSIPTIQSKNMFPRFQIPYRMNPFRHNIGWNELKNQLHLAGYDPAKNFLFSDKYQMASTLSFYSEKQKRAYFLNLQGSRKNQFSFWPGMDLEQKHQKGFFVAIEEARLPEHIRTYEEQLHPYFQQVRFIGKKPIFKAYNQTAKTALIFECSDYNGSLPENSRLY